MFVRALLVCEDVRIEHDGALSLIGVRFGALRAYPTPDGQVQVARAMFVTVVGGLRGQDWFECRHLLRGIDPVHATGEPPLHVEPHEPTADEHTLLFGETPLVLPSAGSYELTTEVVLGPDKLVATQRFVVTVG